MKNSTFSLHKFTAILAQIYGSLRLPKFSKRGKFQAAKINSIIENFPCLAPRAVKGVKIYPHSLPSFCCRWFQPVILILKFKYNWCLGTPDSLLEVACCSAGSKWGQCFTDWGIVKNRQLLKMEICNQSEGDLITSLLRPSH